MSRRQRLALRQIEEPEVFMALSDGEEERDALVQEEARVQEPNFSLLPGMMVNVGSTPEAPIVLLDSNEEMADDQDGHEPTQLVSSQLQNEVDDIPLQKKPRIESDSGPKPSLYVPPVVTESNGAAHAKGVFQLYQPGLCTDHTLRLHFIRQRPPPPPAKRTDDEFVLPRPRINLADLLPPTKPSCSGLLMSESLDQETLSTNEPCDSIRDLHKITQTARDFWKELRSADASTILSWRVLQEHEWNQAFSACGGFVPCIEDLVHVMEVLRSDAFAVFVWKNLLPALVRRIHSENTHSALLPFASMLLSHPHFRRLLAKDFRAQLRGHQLRTIDAAFGAQAELELVTTFHKFRKSDRFD